MRAVDPDYWAGAGLELYAVARMSLAWAKGMPDEPI